MLLAAEHVKKTYRLGRVEVPVLRDASIGIAEGEWVAIVGSSGSSLERDGPLMASALTLPVFTSTSTLL
mgnify:CR=1 FL=1